VDENYNRAWDATDHEGNHWLEYMPPDTTIMQALPSGVRYYGNSTMAHTATSVASGHLQIEGRIKKDTARFGYTLSPVRDTAGLFLYYIKDPLTTSEMLACWPTTMADPNTNWNNAAYYGTIIFEAPGDNVACNALLAPSGTVDLGAAVTPACSVANRGINTETFNVLMKIGASYSQTASVTSLPPGGKAYVTFPTWTPGAYGVQAVKCSTELAGDIVPSDNSRIGTVNVQRLDIGILAIMRPNSVEAPGAVPVQIRVKNYGSLNAASYRIQVDIPDGSYTDFRDLTNLAPGDSFTSMLTPWVASGGVFHLVAKTILSGDNHPENDSMLRTITTGTVDIAVTAITAPPSYNDTLVAITPAAKVKNNGSAAMSFRVWFMFRDSVPAQVYYDTFDVSSLAPGAEQTVTFTAWPFPHPLGTYATKCSTYIAGDPTPTNNILTGSFRVSTAPPTPSGWTQVASMPAGGKGKNVKDGGALAYSPEGDSDFVYALKGNGRYEFYKYNTLDNAWTAKESVPAIGRAGKKKAVKKGSNLAKADGKLYAAKGNGTLEYWQYNPNAPTGTFPWAQMADYPAGAKTLKEGSGAAAVSINDTTYVYVLRGSSTADFNRYNTATGLWESRAAAPAGASGKPFKNGSGLATDGVYRIFAVKGTYNEFFVYNCSTDAWTNKTTLPLIGTGGKKKKVKDGAGIAYADGRVYAQKGNNTLEFWTYQADSDKWTQTTDVPTGGGKRVKGGGALVYAASANALYSLKGNNTLEFFRYGLGAFVAREAANNNIAGQSENPITGYRLTAAPNPFSNATTVRYSLPRAGNITLRLYDVTGKLVSTLASGYHNVGTASFTVSRSSLSSGIYLLKLETDNTTTTSKLIIQ